MPLRWCHAVGRLLLGPVVLGMAACGGGVEPPAAPQATSPPAPVFQTVDGKRFATAAARAAYLNASEAARHDQELTALETVRQTAIASDLGALQRQRHERREISAAREAAAAQAALQRAWQAAARAARTDRQLELEEQRGRGPRSATDLRVARDLEELRARRAQRQAAVAASQADRATRRAALEERLGEARTLAGPPAPWQRLIRYRRAGEPLPDFRRRVVAAINRALSEGGQAKDYL